jgi:hypothetical protein
MLKETSTQSTKPARGSLIADMVCSPRNARCTKRPGPHLFQRKKRCSKIPSKIPAQPPAARVASGKVGGRSYAATRAIGSASLSRALVGSLYIKINIPTYSRRSRPVYRELLLQAEQHVLHQFLWQRVHGSCALFWSARSLADQNRAKGARDE